MCIYYLRKIDTFSILMQFFRAWYKSRQHLVWQWIFVYHAIGPSSLIQTSYLVNSFSFSSYTNYELKINEIRLFGKTRAGPRITRISWQSTRKISLFGGYGPGKIEYFYLDRINSWPKWKHFPLLVLLEIFKYLLRLTRGKNVFDQSEHLFTFRP